MDEILVRVLANADPLIIVLVIQQLLFFRSIDRKMGRVEDALFSLARQIAARHGSPDTPPPMARQHPRPASEIGDRP